MSKYQRLIETAKSPTLELTTESARLALCPGMGGRVFAELAGESLHRIDLETVADPTSDFNNFGGGNFWPAPEGGKFGFNYVGDEWRVQEAINNQPFETVSKEGNKAVIRKIVSLINRAETVVEAVMQRELRVEETCGSVLTGFSPRACVSYTTRDAFQVLNRVSVDQGLIAAWTLEQFDATENTVAFAVVPNPQEAINFDFYEHPGSRIVYCEKGFLYKTDGQSAGQIGIRHASQPFFIGSYDLSRKLLCIRVKKGGTQGLYFNIADNDQPDGPFSAADDYSIYNSAPEMGAFELETVGTAEVADGLLKGSELVSETTFALFDNAEDIELFIEEQLGNCRRI